MNRGPQPGGVSSIAVICGNMKSGYGDRPSSRLTGPPRSNSQYHSANAITLVAQIDAPDSSRTKAGLGPRLWLLTITLTSRSADAALAAVIRTTSAMLAARTGRDLRSIRTGFAANKARISAI